MTIGLGKERRDACHRPQRRTWSRGRRLTRVLAAWFATVALAAAAGGTAVAGGGSTLLAMSVVHGLKVFADGTPDWCGPTLALRLVYDSSSPDLNDPASAALLLDRLRGTIEARCPAAVSGGAVVSGMPGGDRRLTATASGGWRFEPGAGRAAAVPTMTPPEVAQLATLPRDVGYASALVAYLRGMQAALGDAPTIAWWANYRTPIEYQRLQHQEFELQPLLEASRADLARTIASAAPGQVVVPIEAQFGAYDFAKGLFPIVLGGTEITLRRPCCFDAASLPLTFTIHAEDLTLIDGLAMAQPAAEAFIQHRTHGGWVDRRITLLLTYAIEPPGFAAGDNPRADARLSEILFLDPANRPPRQEDVVARLPPSILAAMREARDAALLRAAAAAAQQRDAQQRASEAQMRRARRQVLLAERAQALAQLRSTSLSTRLANASSAGAVEPNLGLDDVRDARARALLGGEPVPVAMLVQAANGGRGAVATSWPGRLRLQSPAGADRWRAGRWYVVRGALSVPEAGPSNTEPPDAVLAVSALLACDAVQCVDRADPGWIVEQKLAAASAAP